VVEVGAEEAGETEGVFSFFFFLVVLLLSLSPLSVECPRFND
jgi:hypothetical protein